MSAISAPTTATVTLFAASATSAQVLAANALRAGATIFNDNASASLFVRLGTATATTSAGGFTVEIVAGGYYEVPFNFVGAIQGVWDSGSGNAATVTELS